MVRENHQDGETAAAVRSVAGSGGSDWQPIAAVMREALADLRGLSTRITQEIRAAMPGYAIVPEAEHRKDVAKQLRLGMEALAERRTLNRRELDAASDLAARRAAEGIRIDSLIGAYQTGERDNWRLVSSQAGPEIYPLLPEFGELLLSSANTTTMALARAYSAATRGMDGERITLSYQLLERLTDPVDETQAGVLAGRLGFDVKQTFIALCWRVPGHEVVDTYAIATALESRHVNAALRATAQGTAELVTQAAAEDQVKELVEAVRTTQSDARVGIGAPRVGIYGAVTSLRDARDALLATTANRPVLDISKDWLEAMPLAFPERIMGFLRPAVDCALENPHLALAVSAFANNRMSIAQAAKASHLHANSLTYRLERWADLTGLDPRTFEGLTQSLMACRLAEDRD